MNRFSIEMCKINFRPLDSLLGEVEGLQKIALKQTFDLSEVGNHKYLGADG